MNGIITNSKSLFKHLFKRQSLTKDTTSKFLFELKNQINLIVILNENFNQVALKESSLKRVPTISLSSKYNPFNSNLTTYKVPGNYTFTKKIIRDNFFFLLLNSLLKKAERFRKKQIQINKKQPRRKYLKNFRKNVRTKKK